MKRNISLIVVTLFLLNSCSKNPEPLKEGKIVTIHAYMDKEGNSKPDTSIMYFKNGNTRLEFKIGGSVVVGPSERIIISNKQKREDYTLFNEDGNYKYATKREIKRDTSVSPEIRKRIESYNSEIIKPDIKLTDDRKQILGFNCKKAILTFKTSDGKQQSYDCWSTNEIGLCNDRSLLKSGVDSFIMAGTTTMVHNSALTTTVASIERVSVPDSLFEIPVGYPIKTEEQAQKEMIAKFSIANGLPVDTAGPIREGTASDTSAPLKTVPTMKHN